MTEDRAATQVEIACAFTVTAMNEVEGGWPLDWSNRRIVTLYGTDAITWDEMMALFRRKAIASDTNPLLLPDC